MIVAEMSGFAPSGESVGNITGRTPEFLLHVIYLKETFKTWIFQE
jgi:hypothetical protein